MSLKRASPSMRFTPSSSTCFLATIILFFALTQAFPTESSLAIRSDGAIAQHFDQEELVKRFSVGSGMAIIAGAGVFAAATCNPAFIVASEIACVVSLFAVLVGVVVGVIGDTVGGSKVRRDIEELRARGVPVVTVHDFMDQYRSSGRPVIALYHDCYGPGCMQGEYSLHITKAGKTMHRVLVGPRQQYGGSNHASLQSRQYDQGSSSYTETSDGATHEYYGDYLFEIDDSATAEDLDTYDNEYGAGFTDTAAQTIDQDLINDNGQGYYCWNLFTNGGTQATSGYVAISEDVQMQDPDNEDSYIQQCNSMGKADYDSLEYYGA